MPRCLCLPAHVPCRARRCSPPLAAVQPPPPAHRQVVPTDYERANSTWEHGVFSGHVDRARDRIYGRGTADDKGHCMAMLEAARALRRVRWQPARTLVFLLGHDEEASGTFGASACAAGAGGARGGSARAGHAAGAGLGSGATPTRWRGVRRALRGGCCH